MRRDAKWCDGKSSYGWISIALHWTAGTLILTLLFVGDSIGTATGTTMLMVHTGLAVSLYWLLWWRLLWRLRAGHPARSPGQGKYAAALGAVIHNILLLALGVLLLSGPPMAFAAGISLRFLGLWAIPSPIRPDPTLYAVLLHIHGYAATVMAIGITIHVAAVMKHILVNKDETLARMMIAGDPRVRP